MLRQRYDSNAAVAGQSMQVKNLDAPYIKLMLYGLCSLSSGTSLPKLIAPNRETETHY